MDGRCFYLYFITHCHSELHMDMNGVKPFICCYNISVVALPKRVALSSISIIFGNVLNVTIFTFLRTPQILALLKQQNAVYITKSVIIYIDSENIRG